MFENLLGKKSAAQGAVIAVEPLSETINFCTANENQSQLLVNSANYKVRPFDREFFDRLAKLVKRQQETHPEQDVSKASVILPDQLFLLDMITVPMIHKKAMQHSLSLAIESIYNNAEALNLMTYSVAQTKQAVTFGLSGVRKDLIDQVRQTFSEIGVNVSGITYASNAMVNGAFALNPKLRGESFLMLDIKADYARFAFVVRGVTMGYYDLPFGHNILYKSRLAAEDLLFDHSAGELLVLNAKERARAKQLTMEGVKPEEVAEEMDGEFDAVSQKSGRRLPKFMQRPTPQSREDYMYENFRIFIKWALELIGNNREITALAKPETVYVNMPKEYGFLFDIINRRKESHKVLFAPLLPADVIPDFAENLELYGGMFLGQYNEANTF